MKSHCFLDYWKCFLLAHVANLEIPAETLGILPRWLSKGLAPCETWSDEGRVSFKQTVLLNLEARISYPPYANIYYLLKSQQAAIPKQLIEVTQ